MSDPRIPSPFGGLFALALLSAALEPKSTKPLPPELRAMLDELAKPCDYPECNPTAPPVDGGSEKEDAAMQEPITEIPPDVAALVGLGAPGLVADSLEVRARVLAAGFIANLRKLGERPESTFQSAGVKLTGIRFAESQMLGALQTFVQLSK